MKAIVWTAYGPPDVLQLQTVEKPIPTDNEVLIKIHAATVTAGDCESRSLKFPLWLSLPMRIYMGWSKPKRTRILGMELAGEVEAVGKGVTLFRPGDPVFAITDIKFGAYAEYKTMPASPKEAALAIKPANMSFEEAAAVPLGGLESLHFLRKGNIQRSEKVLINGAGGSIGTFGVQLAKHFGAEVTAVDSANKLNMLRTLGADHVIDYMREDFTRNGETYDVIFDVIGKSSFSGSIKSLTPNGRYLIANPTPSKMMRGSWISKTSNRQVIFASADHRTGDLVFLSELIEAGKIKTVIDRCYPLAQVPEAHRYVETGQKVGNVIITIAHDGDN